jgi:hypothetical protein
MTDLSAAHAGIRAVAQIPFAKMIKSGYKMSNTF